MKRFYFEVRKALFSLIRKSRKFTALIMCIILITSGLGFELATCMANDNAAEDNSSDTTVTIYLKDNTDEKWLNNDNAVFKLIDNTNGHDSYDMVKVNDTLWSAEVPKTAYNCTFRRYSSDGGSQWNEWSAGGRDDNNTYSADGGEYGHWEYNDEYDDVDGKGDEDDEDEKRTTFKKGDIIYLDLTKFTDWEKDDAVMYVNFSSFSKGDNGWNDVAVDNLSEKNKLIDWLDGEVEDNIYKFTVTDEFDGYTEMRFWRGNDTTLWNDSVCLTFDDYSEGNNCIVVTDWNESGYLCSYEEPTWDDIINAIDTETDSDGDGVPDYIEEFFGTDINRADTDNDGLSDYTEIYVTGTDPTLADSDENGINDGDEDADSDGLSNLEEIKYGTDPSLVDTDGDLISDYNEINKYGTDPLNEDTDNDGVRDGVEIRINTDPLVYDSSFMVHAEADEEDTVKASVDVELTASQVETLNVERFENEFLFPEEMPGYMGGCYEFNVDGDFEEAVINFEFDESLLEDDDFDPVIYYFDEEEQELEALETTIDGNVASTVTEHFSKYILLNRKIYEYAFEWQDIWSTDVYLNTEVVLVIDDSGSMSWNDRDYQRLSVSQTLVDNLPKSSKIGVVSFTDSTKCLTTTLTNDKDKVKSYLTRDYFKSNGGTNMYKAVEESLNLFESTESTTQRIIILLTDGTSGSDASRMSTECAVNERGVKIYGVGLGSDSGIEEYLKPLSINSGGALYMASNAFELVGVFNKLTERIDIETDSDNDGIPDYYEDNMIMFNGIKLVLDKNNPDTDNDGVLDGEEIYKLDYKYNDDKTLVCVTGKIYSNPTNRDTDYDGVIDNNDSKPVSGEFTGSMKGYYDIKEASYYFDYRDFFEDSEEFNQDLCKTSLIFSNEIYEEGKFEYDLEYNKDEIDKVSKMLNYHGFKSIKDYNMNPDTNTGSTSDYEYEDDDVTEVAIGYHNVTYGEETRTVIAVIVRGTDGSLKEWSSNLDVGNADNWSLDSHKGFYNTEKRVMECVEDYVDENMEQMEGEVVYWVTGHSRGAAIANLLSADLIDDGNVVYGYTFGSPEVTVYHSATDSKYGSIFNIKNMSDIVIYLPSRNWGFDTYGSTVLIDILSRNLKNVWCEQTERENYNIKNTRLLKNKIDSIHDRYAKTRAGFYNYSGGHNISDEQYELISDRAVRYCKIVERKSFLGNHKGYKIYPSTIFMLQLGLEMYYGSEKERVNANKLKKEFLNTKYLLIIIDKKFIELKKQMVDIVDISLLADGHSPATYYVIADNIRED